MTIDPASDPCNAYRVSGANPEDGGALVFHFSANKVRPFAWTRVSWIDEVASSMIELKVRKLDRSDHIWRNRTTTEPECIESPKRCPACEMWGGEPITLEREEDVRIWKRGESPEERQARPPDFEKGEEFEACSFCEGDDDLHNWQ